MQCRRPPILARFSPPRVSEPLHTAENALIEPPAGWRPSCAGAFLVHSATVGGGELGRDFRRRRGECSGGKACHIRHDHAEALRPWVQVPDTTKGARVVGYTTRKQHECPDCKTAVANFFSTGKLEHTCKTCGDDLKVCEAH